MCVFIFFFPMMFMYSTEKNKYKLIKFLLLHAYLCIVDEFTFITDECETANIEMNIFILIIICLALFTMCIIFRPIDTLFTSKFTINNE